MFKVLLLALMAVMTVVEAEDAWTKVREIKSGAELRIYKKGVKQPIVANMDEATEDKLIVATKNEQIAILKADIDRIDARPVKTGSRVTKETRTTTESSTEPEVKVAGAPRSQPGASTSTSSSVSFGSKPDFETVYRRTPALPAK